MDPVAGYLEYLREMARKVAYRGTFLNVLFRKSRRNTDRYLSWDARVSPQGLQQYLAAVEQDVGNQDGRTLFIGIGLLAGKLVFDRAANIVAAPLITVPVHVQGPDDTASEYSYDPDWSAASLNYDLVAAVLEKTDTVDPEDEIGLPNQIAPAAAKAVTDIEVEIEEVLTKPGASQGLLAHDFAEKVMSHLRGNVSAFRERVESATVEYRKELLPKLMDRPGRLVWFNHRFCFMGAMPDSLSAYEALNDLCTKLRGGR